MKITDNNGNVLIKTTPTALITTKFIAKNNLANSGNLPIIEIDKTNADKIVIANWGTNNDMPQVYDSLINKIPSLSSGILRKIQLAMGQGLQAVVVNDIKEDGKEIVEYIKDKQLINFLQSPIIRNFLEEGFRDIYKFGNAFPRLIFNVEGTKIIGIQELNALYCRYEMQDKNGYINNLIYSGKFPETPNKDNYIIYPVLSSYDPAADLQSFVYAKKTANKSFVYSIRDRFSNNIYYSTPLWNSAKEAGWLDIAMKLPTMIKYMYENQATIKYHIQFDERLWELKFPFDEYNNVKERNDLIEKFMDDVSANLTDVENAGKSIQTRMEFDETMNGVREFIRISKLDTRWSNEQLITSSVVNSEIFGALQINPSAVGLMPGNGVYQSNSGGSNIRESFLIDLALSYTIRQRLLDPIELMLRFNKLIPEEAELKFKNTFLTTLDTGHGTGHVLS